MSSLVPELTCSDAPVTAKWLQILPVVLLSCLLLSAHASERESAGEVLKAMSNASRKSDYQISFITVSNMGVEISRYTHILQGQTELARLLQLDGPRKEIVQRDRQIIFLEVGLPPFILSGDHIIDALPEIAFSDIHQLGSYYDYLRVGRMRVADRDCEVVRIISKDGSRYSYIVWVDEESRLLMRSELLDADGETLEQFRVVSFSFGDSVRKARASLLQEQLSVAPVYVEQRQDDFNWQLGWLPKGFKEISHQLRSLPDIDQPIQSRLYSDGLFTFSVNIVENSKSENDSGSKGNDVKERKIPQYQQLRQGRRTIYNEIVDNREVTLIGELPPVTVKRIINDIIWRSSS